MKVSRRLITIGPSSRAALPLDVRYGSALPVTVLRALRGSASWSGRQSLKNNVWLFGKPEAFRTSGGKAAIDVLNATSR